MIGADDLLVSHTEKLHLLIIDPSLRDYQHVHPVFEGGAWVFSFMPKFGGVYRIFCYFVPGATGRGLYASADLEVEGEVAGRSEGEPRSGQGQFVLQGDVVAGKQAMLVLSAKESVKLEPVMGAYAHLVAFDLERGGFAHLHPEESGRGGRGALPLTFKVTVPRPGAYVVWAQMRIGGGDVYVPFRLDVHG